MQGNAGLILFWTVIPLDEELIHSVPMMTFTYMQHDLNTSGVAHSLKNNNQRLKKKDDVITFFYP